ncbi:hypothetical protein MC7420_2512 [Coleofasciculus chthonoplastes PCC 7420]|uniref:Uncharacterized protein n=1 Tax=Coleofasciculus chthonoplastes PCC 7420 TaxID=118168 RepID=B4VZL3_9CYAN|nr:hypothetical protein MC7420_2512 [Coleofasciculus chthonoplastes PCC 7420]
MAKPAPTINKLVDHLKIQIDSVSTGHFKSASGLPIRDSPEII